MCFLFVEFLYFSFTEEDNVGMCSIWHLKADFVSFDEGGKFLLALSLSLTNTGWFCDITTNLQANFGPMWHMCNSFTFEKNNICIFIDSGFCKKRSSGCSFKN